MRCSFMGLSDAADKLVRKYSGGMIRRLEIAHHAAPAALSCSSMSRPSGWTRWRAKRYGSTSKVCANSYGTTIFFTTHYMEEADDLCGRVAIMHAGKVVVIGTPEEFKLLSAAAELHSTMCLSIMPVTSLESGEITVKQQAKDAWPSDWAEDYSAR